MESLESILTDLQVKYQSSDSKKASQDLGSQDLGSQDLSNQDLTKPAKSAIATNLSSLDRLLADLRNKSPNESKAIEPEIDIRQGQPVSSQAINHDLQQVADRQKAKDREQFTQHANEWLKKLDPLSGEGLWFEEFAKNYPSRLEAAIALIAAK
ncbi:MULTISPECIES: salt stress protein, Slr1339 family [Pseudanabaena]|uniref:Uncharacterized protein n=2 Tax=Pseudanabaena TaxID=1152 RepID=L8N2B3_9CYAN|nr:MULTISPECIES: hypothetical protein [Pseudanabaena]ELS32408.1 hypothetical protein Pse7429DRAFT_2327 [Pseudanabaena biceps PCC 7429]MDG3495362.1 hypothetical protein [Pseudanabaena catenata USMAC16]